MSTTTPTPDAATPQRFGPNTQPKLLRVAPHAQMPWLRTASGRKWQLGVVDPAQVHWPDVAASLAKICRFSGATQTHYSVAQHSVIVAEIVAERHKANAQAPLYALLHDAHEMVLGDIPAPTRTYLHQAIGWKLFDAFAQDIDEAVTRAAGLPWPVPGDIAQAIGLADIVARHAEARHLLPEPQPGVPDWPELVGAKPWRAAIRPLTWDRAEELFLARLRQLAVLAGTSIRI